MSELRDVAIQVCHQCGKSSFEISSGALENIQILIAQYALASSLDTKLQEQNYKFTEEAAKRE